MGTELLEQQLKEDLSKWQRKEQLYKTLGNRTGFFQYYFEKLPLFRTQQECFIAVNSLHLELFGEERYADYYSFKTIFYKNKPHLK